MFGSKRAPYPFELIDLGDQRAHFGGNQDVGGHLEDLALSPIYPPQDGLSQGVFKPAGHTRSGLAGSCNRSMGGKTGGNFGRRQFRIRRQITLNLAGRGDRILIERKELYASVDGVAQEDRETLDEA